jgi:hypothetical protein
MSDVPADDLKELNKRVAKLETTRTVAVTVAAVLGVGFGYINHELTQIQNQAEAAKAFYDKNDATLVAETAHGVEALQQERQAQSQAFKAQAREFLASNLLTGQTSVGAINGHHAEYLDAKIAFTDEHGKPRSFNSVPRVVATADRGAAQDDVSWAVTILAVQKDGFVVRVRSVDQHHEGNPGWNGSVGVQWVAIANLPT